ncbi:MAG TPA: class I SAM-dependent methyltransferase [Segetibacter sp.]
MSTIITYDHCICCGSAAISKVFTCKDNTVSKQLFEIWKCDNCTLRFTQHVPDEELIGAYYRSADYVSHTDTKKGLINTLYHRVRNYTVNSKRDLIKKVTGLKQGVLLDVGAGTGAFANVMHQSGWHVTGLEPDETARTNALNAYQLQLGELKNLHQLPAQTYDAITLWHVLEHVHELHNYLEKFFEILKPAGRLIIAVPNYCSFDAEYYNNCWAAYDVPRHLYHFSPKSMQLLLEQKGFYIEAHKPMWFDSFYVSMLSEKDKNGKNNFMRAFWVGLKSNMKAFADTKKCSSITYIVRKK